MKKFLSFIVIIISTLYGNNTMAQTCPAGCFCMNGGQTTKTPGVIGVWCSVPAEPVQTSDSMGSPIGFHYIAHSSMPDSSGADYYIDEFSELYLSELGAYGFINNEFVYLYGAPSNAHSITDSFDLLACPKSHPHSAGGAKALTECFKYNENGNKIYYGANNTINCAPGQYLPANATSCSNCNASKNQICTGGSFERADTIQGLKVNCNPGQYLPANATQCSACDNKNYSCSGGIYEFNATITQGLNTQHNGYINAAKSDGGLHNYITCQPGQYMPATVNTCTACTGDYACPGGIFYTDATYTQDRGRILCAYGTANTSHTACISQSTLPSFMRNKIQATVNTNTTNQTVDNNTTNNQSGTTTTTTTTTGKNDAIQSITTKKFDFANLSSPFTSAKVAKTTPTRSAISQQKTITRSATIVTPTIKRNHETPNSIRTTQTKERISASNPRHQR